MTISEVDSKESGLTYGLTYGMTTVNIRFNIIFTAFSTFWYVGYIGFFAYRLFAYRLFVHDCLVFVVSAFCHIGFLFYRLIDIGFLTVGFFRSAFDLESKNWPFGTFFWPVERLCWLFLPFSAICDHTIAENGRKSQHNLLTGQKKVPKGQFLQGSRNWQKCSALAYVPLLCE
jgi:hypothetical protein